MGRASLFLGVPAPFVYPLARVLCCRLLSSLLLPCVPPFCVSGGYAPPLSVAPRFWIVYALAMRVSAYYALGLGLFVCASHGAALSCGSCCSVWGCRARGCGVRLAFR